MEKIIITSAKAEVLILRFSSLAGLFTPVAPTGINLEGSNLPKIYFDSYPRSERKLNAKAHFLERDLIKAVGALRVKNKFIFVI